MVALEPKALLAICYIAGFVFNYFITALWCRKWPAGDLATTMKDGSPFPFFAMALWPGTILILSCMLLAHIWNRIASPPEKKIPKGKTSEGGYR